ncbi:MAG: TlpA family protein disulfide reductase [Lewinella sp.]
MKRLLITLLFCSVLGTIFAQQGQGLPRPWDADWKTSHVNQVNRLKSDTLYQIVPVEGLEATLETRTGEEFSLPSVLKDLRGQTVVIDLWATYCPPCIRAFPEFSRLTTNFKDKPVSFVYISIDHRLEDWQRFTANGFLSNADHTYRLKNRKEAPFCSMIALSSVPRYLIFDRQGRLCHAFAPGPSDGLEGYINSMLLDDQVRTSENKRARN